MKMIIKLILLKCVNHSKWQVSNRPRLFSNSTQEFNFFSFCFKNIKLKKKLAKNNLKKTQD